MQLQCLKTTSSVSGMIFNIFISAASKLLMFDPCGLCPSDVWNPKTVLQSLPSRR